MANNGSAVYQEEPGSPQKPRAPTAPTVPTSAFGMTFGAVGIRLDFRRSRRSRRSFQLLFLPFFSLLSYKAGKFRVDAVFLKPLA